jgi:SPP1 gp7 family putative phage head morphogenesis protein
MASRRRVALRDEKRKGGKPSWKVTTKVPEWKEAVDAFRARTPMTAAEFRALDDAMKAQAFTVAGVAQLDVVAEVWRSLDHAIAAGRTFEEWKSEVGGQLERAWGGENPNRLATIFRTNVQSAYSAGRWAQMTDPDVLAVQTHWQFDAVIDDATTEVCEECDGTVLPAGDAWWHRHNPPLHFSCRSGITTLTADAAKDLGISATGPSAAPDDGFGHSPDGGVPAWKPNPDDYPAALWNEKEIP